MKKLLCVALAVLMLVTVCACGVDKGGDQDFEKRNETVYALGNVNVRSTPSSESKDNIVATLKDGEAVKRIGYNEDWSEIEYNGETRYVASEYLSTNKPTVADDIVFEEVDELIYVKEGQTIKIRSTPNTESTTNELYVATEGYSVRRTGIYVEDAEEGTGWSRIIYVDADGKETVAYTRSYYWTTERPAVVTTAEEGTTAEVTTTEVAE